MEFIIDQPKDKVKDEILLKNNCVFSQQQFLGAKGAEALANEEVSGTVSDMYAAMDEYGGLLISQREYVSKITEIPKHILDEYSRNESVEFVEWANRNYTYVELNLWDGDDDETFTTSQIYSLYLNHKQQQSEFLL